MVQKFLFVCGRARQRSLTAEELFSNHSDIEARAAGISTDADNPVTPELIDWADRILVMEKQHKSKLNQKFGEHLKNKRIVVLGIPDKFEYMAPRLIEILRRSIHRLL